MAVALSFPPPDGGGTGSGASLECSAPPSAPFSQASLLMRRPSYLHSPFCTQHNLHECLVHVSQVGVSSRSLRERVSSDWGG